MNQSSAGANERAIAALGGSDSSVRLRAALHIGTYPHDGYVVALVERSGHEDDFFVRDMLTWALTRHRSDIVLPLLAEELRADQPERRSQALHTVSKIGDARAWPWITADLLHDADDEVARSAWRAAVVLVPEADRHRLATELLGELGRGDREVQRSLSRAVVALGTVVEPLLAVRMKDARPRVRAHAIATDSLRRDPDSDFQAHIEEADRMLNRGTDLR